MAILTQDQFDQQVLNLINQYRAQNGLSGLILSQELDQTADKYANRMATGDFFSHTDPNGSTPFTRMRAEGYQYTTAGENIAAGYATPESVVQGWIDSPGHRANILNPNYKHMGIGYAYLANDTGSVNYRHYWVQTFGAGDTDYGVYAAETTDVLPVITIAATDANAAETNTGQTANPGRFTLTRTGSTTAALTVNYTIAGSATKGTDYNNRNRSLPPVIEVGFYAACRDNGIEGAGKPLRLCRITSAKKVQGLIFRKRQVSMTLSKAA